MNMGKRKILSTKFEILNNTKALMNKIQKGKILVFEIGKMSLRAEGEAISFRI